MSYSNVYILGVLPTMYDYINGSVIEEEARDATGQLQTKTVNTCQEYTGGVAPIGNGHIPVLFWIGNAFPVSYPYKLYTGGDLKNNKLLRIKTSTTTDYRDSGEKTQEITYSYDNALHYKLSRMITSDSRGNILTTKAFYPQDIDTEPFMAELMAQNRFNAQIKSETYKGIVEDPEQTLLYAQYTDYDNTTSPGGLVLPSQVRTLKSNSGNEEQRQVYENYDDQGHLLQYRQTDGTPVSYIWGYDNTHPIAKLDGIAYSDIDPATIANLKILSDNDQDVISEETLRDQLNALRGAYPDAMITTFTYDPLVGVTSITDSRNYKSFYIYDQFNRLKSIKDANGNRINAFNYNYAQGAIPLAPLSTMISYGSDDSDHQWFTSSVSGGSGDYSYAWHKGVGTSSFTYEVNVSSTLPVFKLFVDCSTSRWVKLVITDNVTGETVYATKESNNSPCSGGEGGGGPEQ